MGAPLECPTVRQVGFPSTLARRLSNGSSAHETLNAVSLRIQVGLEWTNKLFKFRWEEEISDKSLEENPFGANTRH